MLRKHFASIAFSVYLITAVVVSQVDFFLNIPGLFSRLLAEMSAAFITTGLVLILIGVTQVYFDRRRTAKSAGGLRLPANN